MFETNVLGALFGKQHQLRIMQAQDGDSIVSISSTMGQHRAANFSIYARSMRAAEGIMKYAAIEAGADGVRVVRPNQLRKIWRSTLPFCCSPVRRPQRPPTRPFSSRLAARARSYR